MAKAYTLSLCIPTEDKPICVFKSDVPFGSIQTEDRIYTQGLPGAEHVREKFLRVARVKHRLWEISGAAHHAIEIETEVSDS